MKLKNCPLAALTCVSFFGSAAVSRAAVIVSEDFNGTSSGLSSGWSSLSVTGGVATGNNPSSVSLSTAFASSGTLWVSFDWGNSAKPAENNSYGGLTFFNGASEKLLIGNGWPGTGHDVWGMGGAGLSSELNYSGMKTGVAKITLGAGATSTVELWVGATGSPVDVSGAALLTATGRDLAGVNGIRINGQDFGGGITQSFDNLLIGTNVSNIDATAPTWTNTSGGLWNTTGNWLSGIVGGGGSGKNAYFDTLDISTDTTVNLDSPLTIGSLSFGDTDTATAAAWTLGNNGNTANILTLAGTTPTITVNALGTGKSVTISAEIAGTDGLTKTGAGTLVLTAGNNYTGSTTVSQGTLQLGDGGTTGSLSTSSAIVNNGNLTINRSNAVTQGTDFSGAPITGSGSFTQAGSGTTILTAANTYSGTTTISGGSLQIGNGGTTGSLSTSSAIVNNGILTINRSDAVTQGTDFSGAAITGSGSFTQAGTGTTTLNAANTYTGLTTVSAGVLKLTGGAFSTTARTYAISSGAVLNLDGNTGVASGTTILDGIGTLRITGGTFANETPNEPKGDNRDISMELDAGALIDVQSGATMFNGGWQNITWTNNKAGLNADGTFDLADGQNVFVDALTGAGTVTTGASKTLTVGVDNGSGTFSGIIGGNTVLTKNGSGTQTLTAANTYSGTTTISGGTLQIGNGGTTGSLSTSSAITNNGNLMINRSNAVVQGTDFSSAAITGSGSFTQAGTGTTTLNAANTYSGNTTISAGTLVVSGQSYFNVGRTTTIASGAFFELNNSNNVFTTQMPVSSVTGAGTFRLSGTSAIDQSEGGTPNITRLTFAMDSGGLIDLQDTSKITNGGWQVMDWTNNKADMNIASGAILDRWDGNTVFVDALSGAGTVTGGATLTVGVDGGSGTFSGVITGTRGIIKNGTGTQTLSGTNTHSGLTNVTAGTLLATKAAALPGYDAASRVSVASGATLAVRAGVTGEWTSGEIDSLLGATTAAFAIGSKLGIEVTTGNTFSYATDIGATQAAKGLVKSGDGTLTLTGANTYTGATEVSDGTLVISGQSYFNVGRTTSIASGAVLELNNSNNSFNTLMPESSITGAGTFKLSGDSTINQVDGGVSNNTRLTFAMDSGGLIDLQGTSKLTNGGWKEMVWTDNKADLNIASGATFDIWDGNEVRIDALKGEGSIVKGHPDPNTFLLTVGVDNGSGDFGGTIQNNSGGGALALTKTGTGTQTLSGANSYNGATTVNGGILNITGSTASGSAVTVGGSSAIGTPKLTGDGTITGAVTVKSASGGAAGILSAGDSTTSSKVGTLAMGSNLTFESGSIFEWDLASGTVGTRGTDHDGVNVGGTLADASGAIFKVVLGSGAFTDAFWNTNRTWSDIFKAGVDGSGAAISIASVFSGIDWYQGLTDVTSLTSAEGSFSITNSTLTWTAVPEPTSALAGLLITAGLLRRRRKLSLSEK